MNKLTTILLAIAAASAQVQAKTPELKMNQEVSHTIRSLEQKSPKTFKGIWATPINFNGITYHPLKKLNLEEIEYTSSNFPSEFIAEQGNIIEIQAKYPEPLKLIKNNAEKLKRAMRPSDGSGNPLLLCSITKPQSTDYFELTQAQWKVTTNLLGIAPEQYDDYCLSNKLSENYWLKRYTTIVDSSNRIIQ